MTTELPRVKPQTITITDKRELYKCYMPFIKGGGLFIPFTNEVGPAQIYPGQTIFVMLSILDGKMKTPAQGKVVWISKGGIQKGYGISFIATAQTKALKEAIELSILDLAQRKDISSYTL